jgi:nucleotide-binding universal stress UspA family protein
MKRILVPTDFSENALVAITYAAEMAVRTGASVHLLHASGIGHDKFIKPVSIYEKYNNLVLDESNEKLQELISVLKNNYPGVDFFSEVEPEQHITEAIKKYVKEHNIELVIMGTKGATGLKSVLMGSVAATTVTQTAVPVLTLPQHFIPDVPKQFLLATNHFEQNSGVTATLLELVHVFSSALHLVMFIDPSKSDIADEVRLREKFLEYESFLKKKHPSLYLQSHVLEGNSLEDALELYSLKNNIDIICLVSYPKSFFEKLFLKSTTRNMTFHSRLPVLAIPGLPKTIPA